MAETLHFDLVSPERRLQSVAAIRVQIPGMAGDFTAMPNHAPFLTTLRPGIVQIVTASETLDYVVTGGFAEVSPDAATVLAEVAVPREAAAGSIVAELIAETEKAVAEARDDATRQAADQRLRDARELEKRLKS